MPRGQKTSPEKKEEVRSLNAEGKSQREISEITGVSQTTVQRICAKSDNTKEEPAPSANDTSSEETIPTTIVPEIPADVNPCDEISDEDFCCEVTGDTYMEAYMADREKFFAAKKRDIPDAVKEACLRMREDELSKIDALLDEIKFRRERVKELEKFLEVRQ